jgi:hypothetical protein
MQLDEEGRDIERAMEISREVREEHNEVLLRSMKKAPGYGEFTQQNVIKYFARLAVLLRYHRPLNMILRDMENSGKGLIANKLRQEIEEAERDMQFQ